MQARFIKKMSVFVLVFLLVIPAFAAHAATSAQATAISLNSLDPTAPVISYTTTHSSISLSWSASNAVNYDIYKSNTYVTTTSGTSYTLSATPSTSIEVKIVARNSTGQTASSTVWASTPGYSDSYTGTAYGNIQVGGTFKNTHATYSTTMYLTLYRVTSSGDQYVGSTSFSVGAGQTITGYYPIATSQPYGTYKVTFSSPFITASGVSFSTF